MAMKEAFKSWLESIKSLWSTSYVPTAQVNRRDFDDLRKVNTALLPLLLLGFGAVIGIGWRASAVGPLLLWAMACLSVGATVGFLFGIPRSGDGIARHNGARRPNTDLEEVSDRLTKILVGGCLKAFEKAQVYMGARPSVLCTRRCNRVSANPCILHRSADKA